MATDNSTNTILTEYILQTGKQPKFPRGRRHQIIAISLEQAIQVLMKHGYTREEIKLHKTFISCGLYIKSWKA